MKYYLIYMILPIYLQYLFIVNITDSIDSIENIVLEKKDIIIYDLDPSETINHFKAHYFVDASVQHFTDMILEPENHVRWVHNIKSAEKINESNDTVIYTRIIIGVQSIFKKEAIVKTTVNYDNNSKTTYVVQQIDDSIKYEAKHDKLNIFTANWQIKYVSDSKTEVELIFEGEKDDYPDFIDSFLRSLFIKKLYKLAYRSKEQVNKINLAQK